MKQKTLILLLIVLLIVTSATIYSSYIVNTECNYQIYVEENTMDLSQFGVRQKVILSGDYQKDIKLIDSISEQITINKAVNLDSNGLPVSDEIFIVPEIIPRKNANIYSVYMADVLTKLRFCYGSSVISKNDTLKNSCISISPGVDDPDTYQQPYYYVEIVVSNIDSFCISKKYSSGGEMKYERICYNNMENFEKCAIGLSKFGYRLNDSQYNMCKQIASSIDNKIRYYYFPYSIYVDTRLSVQTAVKKIIGVKEMVSEMYGCDDELKNIWKKGGQYGIGDGDDRQYILRTIQWYINRVYE